MYSIRTVTYTFIPYKFLSDDFRYMKFMYLQCDEEMELRDPRN